MMSKQLTTAVPPQFALRHIARVDEQCERLDSSAVVDITQGPFGVFKLSAQDHDNDASDSTLDDGDSLQTPEQDAQERHGVQSTTDWWPEVPEMLQMLQNTSDDLELWNQTLQLHDATFIPDLVEMPVLPESVSNSLIVPSTPEIRSRCLAVSRSVSPVPWSRVDIPQSAWTLLKYYTKSVSKLLTPYHHKKTPWHILFLPLAKGCLAGLTLQESLDDATLCVFYGMLAISALSLGGTAQSQDWTRKSDTYRWRAIEHMKTAGSIYNKGPKAAKYKTLLMALLTMAQLSVFSGKRGDTEYFLVEAEKLIRICGLNRKKSRKVRLLHHCYAYERIFFESTCPGGQTSSEYHHSVRYAIESSGASSYSKDSLSFKLPPSDNLEAEMLLVKDIDLGENDLHLQYPGLWPPSQYEEIFGLPERYILFVSLIVRLAREKEGKIDDDQPSHLTMKSFTNRAKAIERCIKQSRPPEPRPDTAIDHLVAATHNAVVVYFYRKIHDVDACMLERQVTAVQSALLDYEASNVEKGFGSVRLLWPAFIAACEAEEQETQTFFAKWFESAAQETGLRVFDATVANIERIWKQKRDGSGTSTAYLSCMYDGE